MKAGVASPDGVAITDVPEPKPGPTEILVRIKAVGINRADMGAARGDTSHGARAGGPIGSEYAGEVVEVGSAAPGWKVGDRVMCHCPGAYAEFAACDHGRAIPVPAGLSWEKAATLPIGLDTLHDALVTNGRLARGESVLVQGASSGVGLLGLQIAKFMGAGLVVGSSTNAARREKLKDFGADLAIDSNDPGWPDQVLAATGGKGLDLTVDMVSGATVNQTMRATRLTGRIVNIGRLGGMTGTFDFDLHARRRIDYVGVTFRTRTNEEAREIVRRMWADLAEAVAAGRIAIPVDRTFPLAEARAAHDHMRTNSHLGKLVLLA